MSQRGHTFAADFGRLVGPALAEGCKTQALFVVLGRIRFAEAQRCVMDHALNRGAGNLAEEDFSELQERIATCIIEAINRYEPIVEAAFERSRRLARLLAV